MLRQPKYQLISTPNSRKLIKWKLLITSRLSFINQKGFILIIWKNRRVEFINLAAVYSEPNGDKEITCDIHVTVAT